MKTGTVATAIAAAPRVFAQQPAQEAAGTFYERGPVRISYEETGSGFPLLLIAGGGLNSTMPGLRTSAFNPIEEFRGVPLYLSIGYGAAVPRAIREGERLLAHPRQLPCGRCLR